MPRARGAGGWCRHAWIDRLLTNLNARVLPVSEALAEELARRGVPRGKIAPLADAIDHERFRSARARRREARAALGLPEDARLVVNAGRLVPQKAQADFVAAAARLAAQDGRWRFAIAGDGPLRGALERQAARQGLGGRLEFLSFRTDLPELFAAADAFVQTSRWEGLAMALLEARAAGLGIVATDVGGTREGLSGYPYGRCVAPGDIDALARAVPEVVDFGRLEPPPFPTRFTGPAVASAFLSLVRESIAAGEAW
ncbi:MAG: glycosyltransferase [Candidatus Eisenbacteria bacterium]|uniref:Glycosyltransferase n=1 Tax=Eiseniibacteriota bacterium TaxID=2212470 RepID=A0A938BME1_UNCEI|nr:glycosyltransferase [Candidatus Eisenbacteria bacterium]